jgi:hypothetical protein
MMQEGLRHFTDTPITVFAMLIFLAAYIGVVFKLSRPRDGDWQAIARIPLEGDSHE